MLTIIMYAKPKTIHALSHLIFTITLEIIQHYCLYLISRKTDIQIIGIAKIDNLEPILSNTMILSQK